MEALLNRLTALLALIFLAPLFVVAAAAIVLSDYGPVIHRATRMGKDGKKITVYKFRSMKLKTKFQSRITGRNDPRIFAFGQFIRLTKIDELPQLVNVLKGDMNIVGPRPEDVSIVEDHYDEVMWESLSVNPGMASPGSIYNYTHVDNMLDSDNSEEAYIKNVLSLKVRLDVVYTRNKNFLYDLQVIGKTVAVIIQKLAGRKEFALPKEFVQATQL